MRLSLLAAAVLAAMAAAGPAHADELAAERWTSRVVIVFGDGKDERAVAQIAALLADRRALAERDMLVISVEGEKSRAAFGQPKGKLDTAALRRAFGVPAETPFAVILIGKDGSEKRRSEEPLPASAFFDQIDAMPMRRREIGG